AVAGRKKYVAREYRTLEYNYVPGAHVRPNRANDLASANTAGLPQYDVHNALESVWDLLTEGDDDGRMVKFIFVHDIGEDGYETVFDDEHDEICRLSDPDQIREFSNVRDPQRMAGEYYKLEFEYLISDGNYDQ
ncbi:MAG: hypothetical protein ACLFVJ_22830, partial [Persicimonas sp.]